MHQRGLTLCLWSCLVYMCVAGRCSELWGHGCPSSMLGVNNLSIVALKIKPIAVPNAVGSQ